jgi:hypothetical protein
VTTLDVVQFRLALAAEWHWRHLVAYVRSAPRRTKTWGAEFRQSADYSLTMGLYFGVVPLVVAWMWLLIEFIKGA